MEINVLWPWYPASVCWQVQYPWGTQSIEGHSWKQHTQSSWATSPKKKEFEEFFGGYTDSL